ncbi:MAG: hypothetical protein ACK53Y_14410, partial [bacterium]
GQGFCSGGKSESGGKNPVEQVLQYNKSSREYKEDTSNEKELLGCQGKSEPERKIPDKQELQGEKKSSDSEVQIMGTENPNCVQHEDSVSEGIFNTRQEIDTSVVVST